MIIRYPIQPEITMITPFPMNISMEPIVVTMAKRPALRTMSQKVSQALAQKLLLVRAT
jgi:hypothetical protein